MVLPDCWTINTTLFTSRITRNNLNTSHFRSCSAHCCVLFRNSFAKLWAPQQTCDHATFQEMDSQLYFIIPTCDFHVLRRFAFDPSLLWKCKVKLWTPQQNWDRGPNSAQWPNYQFYWQSGSVIYSAPPVRVDSAWTPRSPSVSVRTPHGLCRVRASLCGLCKIIASSGKHIYFYSIWICPGPVFQCEFNGSVHFAIRLTIFGNFFVLSVCICMYMCYTTFFSVNSMGVSILQSD